METYYLVTLNNLTYQSDIEQFLVSSKDDDIVLKALLTFLKYDDTDYLRYYQYENGYGSFKNTVEWADYSFDVNEIKLIN